MEKPEKALEPVETANKLMIETAEEEKTEPMSEDSEIEPVVKKQKKKRRFHIHNNRARSYKLKPNQKIQNHTWLD